MENAQTWRDMFGLTHPVLYDETGKVWNLFNKRDAVPLNFVLNDSMIVDYIVIGYSPEEMSNIRNRLVGISTPLVKIQHTQLPNTENITMPYHVSCEIRAGGNLLPDTLTLNWNTDGSQNCTSVPLVAEGENVYAADIPAHEYGTTIYYYLHAEADNGKSRNSPNTAQAAENFKLHSFNILLDSTPPVITHETVDRWVPKYWSPPFNAEVTDDLPLAYVHLEYRVNGGDITIMDMAETKPGQWFAEIPGPVADGDVVEYRIAAMDTAVSQNTTFHPETGMHTIAIIDPIPALVLDLDQNHNSGPAIRDTLEGLGIHTEYLTEIPPFFDVYDSAWICLGTAPNNYVLSYDDDKKIDKAVDRMGRIYLESGNFWTNDNRVDLFFRFGIGTLSGEEADAGPVIGVSDQITEGMFFEYTGDNNKIDRLKTKGNSIGLFRNADPPYLTTVMNTGDNFKTIASSIEFGGLVDGQYPNNRSYLMKQYLDFFGLPSSEFHCPNLGVSLWMPAQTFYPGDLCAAALTICNPDPTTYQDIPLFVILEVYGSLFFWPSFTDFDYREMDIIPGGTTVEVLPEFNWPDHVGTAPDIHWYAAMTDIDMTELFGDLAMWTFGWAE